MNEDKLRNLFEDYEPEMQSDAMFMARLEQNLRAVEFLKEKNVAEKRANRVAIAVACAAGFIGGGLFFSAIPYITQWLNTQSFIVILPSFQPEKMANVLTCCVGCVSTVVLTLASYDIALGLVGHRDVHESQKNID